MIAVEIFNNRSSSKKRSQRYDATTIACTIMLERADGGAQ
ncbi:hypothetical protein Tco_1387827, partial [Tanacetum coccineum]